MTINMRAYSLHYECNFNKYKELPQHKMETGTHKSEILNKNNIEYFNRSCKTILFNQN